MRRRTFALLFLTAMVACGGKTARDRGTNDPSTLPLSQQPVSITLESPNSGTLPSGVLGNSVYFAGQQGEQYIVRVKNNTADRVEIVVTVDGRDVVSGELGDYAKQRGYIVEPFGSIVVDGFRQSYDRVAAFRFAGLESSYTALRGTPENAGVIGVAVFEEKASKKKTGPLAAGPTPFPTNDGGAAQRDATTSAPPAEPAPFRGGPRDRSANKAESERSAPSVAEEGAVAADDAAAPPSATATGKDGGGNFAPPPVPRNELGTQYGETRFSSVHEVEFKRKHRRKPDAIVAVFYDSERGLQARGVPIGGAFVVDPNEPQPFPRR